MALFSHDRHRNTLSLRPTMRSLCSLLVAVIPFGVIVAQSPAVTLDHESKHHLVLANEWVHVLDVTVPPGDSTLYHVHPNDYVYVTFGAVDLKAQPLGGPATDLRLADGEVRFTKAPISHRVSNPSRVPFHNLTIEMLKPSGVPLSATPDGKIALENDRVRVERIVLEPGQASARHEHHGPWLDVAVGPGTVDVAETDGTTRRVTYRPAAYHWNSAARTHTLKNVGRTRVELLEIEWK
jgi:quercetin dioxygenase-like cupin family protein